MSGDLAVAGASGERSSCGDRSVAIRRRWIFVVCWDAQWIHLE